MRKLFWSCLAAGVLLVAGVFTTAQLAVRHPDSVIGQAMYAASHIAVVLNPFSGFGPALAHLHKGGKPTPAHVEGDEPVEVCEPAGADLPVAVAESDPGAAILIPEDEPIPPAPMPVGPDSLAPVQHPDPFLPGTECPPSELAQAAPTVMPYCSEEPCEEPAPPPCRKRRGCCHKRHQPAEEDSEKPSLPCGAEEEVLPMPRAETVEHEQQEADDCPFGCAQKFLRLFEQMLKKNASPDVSSEDEGAEKPAPTPECREDCHRHHHYSGCPYTGRSYPSSPSMQPCQPPAPKPEKPADQPGGEEANEDGSKQARKKIRLFKSRADDSCPVHPDVDTMEYRPSDRQLHDYGPGPL